MRKQEEEERKKAEEEAAARKKAQEEEAPGKNHGGTFSAENVPADGAGTDVFHVEVEEQRNSGGGWVSFGEGGQDFGRGDSDEFG